MSVQRHRQSTAATLRVVFTNELGLPEDRAGGVTVGVTRADGTVLIASGTATAHGTTGEYTKVLTPAQTSTLDLLTATWRDVANDVTWTTYHRIVGGFLFSIADARAHDDTLLDSGKYPNELIAAKRTEVENEAEWICDRAFVPSYARVTVDGAGTSELRLGLHDLRLVRTVTVFDNLAEDGVAFDAAELASIALLPGGLIRRTDGGIFPFGSLNIVVEAEYGLDAPDPTLATAAMTRLVSTVNARKSGLPDRARSWTSPDGNTYELAGPNPYSTGIDVVDAVYERYSKRARHTNGTDGAAAGAGGVEQLPASQTLSYDPQWYGLFRGGPR